jgi:hypothetical protein
MTISSKKSWKNLTNRENTSKRDHLHLKRTLRVIKKLKKINKLLSQLKNKKTINKLVSQLKNKKTIKQIYNKLKLKSKTHRLCNHLKNRKLIRLKLNLKIINQPPLRIKTLIQKTKLTCHKTKIVLMMRVKR